MKFNNNNHLRQFFEKNKNGKLIHKWLHYFDIYERHFRQFVGHEITIVEFGVSHGGSLDMWRNYFGAKARIVGVDINPECKKLANQNTEIYIGDQANSVFLRKLIKKIGLVDIVIDDGGHTVRQQINTFRAMYPITKTPGIYLVEDLHTNYWNEYGGGLRKQGTFIELAKDLTDQLNAWHSRDTESLRVDEFTKCTQSMHFYDSIIVFEKNIITEPNHQQRGLPMIGDSSPHGNKKKDKASDVKL